MMFPPFRNSKSSSLRLFPPPLVVLTAKLQHGVVPSPLSAHGQGKPWRLVCSRISRARVFHGVRRVSTAGDENGGHGCGLPDASVIATDVAAGDRSGFESADEPVGKCVEARGIFPAVSIQGTLDQIGRASCR